MNQNVLKDYVLSQYTMGKLEVIREKLREDITKSDPLWQIICGKKEEVTYGNMDDTLGERNETCNDILCKESDVLSSSQFYFTQYDKQIDKYNNLEHGPKLDIVESLFEGLEYPNGKLDINQLEDLTDTELTEIVCGLEKRLTMLGTYNLCRTMNSMTLEQRIKYATIFHSHFLLPKVVNDVHALLQITASEEPSRLLSSAIKECVEKFPDDIQKLIFIPLLNVDLKNRTIIHAIVNAFEPQRYVALITEYLSTVKELQLWHLSFLHNLISMKTDAIANNKFVQLLYEKAFDFAKDKNFAKLVLAFVKVKRKLTDEQKQLLWEITNINQTLFKKPIQNVLKVI